jgi:hypothetical protein
MQDIEEQELTLEDLYGDYLNADQLENLAAWRADHRAT